MEEISEKSIENSEKNSSDEKTKLLSNESIDYQNCDNQYSVVVDRMSAVWDPKTSSPTLRDITLQLKHGELLAVIGPVGSGKVWFQ